MASTTGTNTREKLLTAANSLMVREGYSATTVDRICAAAGVSKGSFYHFFGSKEELGLRTLEHFYVQIFSKLASGPFNDIEDPLERAYGFLQHVEESVKDMYGGGGCLLGNFASELADTHPRMRAELSRIFEDLVDRLAPVFEPVAERSRKGATPSGKDLAEMFLAVLEGSIILATAHADPSRIVRGMRGFRDYLQRIASESR